jgi:hypothetical protein
MLNNSKITSNKCTEHLDIENYHVIPLISEIASHISLEQHSQQHC